MIRYECGHFLNNRQKTGCRKFQEWQSRQTINDGRHFGNMKYEKIYKIEMRKNKELMRKNNKNMMKKMKNEIHGEFYAHNLNQK